LNKSDFTSQSPLISVSINKDKQEGFELDEETLTMENINWQWVYEDDTTKEW